MSKYQVLIDALKKGRETFPNESDFLFDPARSAACAVGAIAVGLGYKYSFEDTLHAYGVVDETVRNLDPTLPEEAVKTLTNKIYKTNDSNKQGNRDQAVIKLLESLE